MKHVIPITCIIFTIFSGPVHRSVENRPQRKPDDRAQYYSDNWTGGEAGSFTWETQFLGVA
jgi:hypothetical protein